MTAPRLIAQNLNASDPAVSAALAAGDSGWLRSVVRRIEATGVDAIDLNAGTFGTNERNLLGWLAGQVEPLTKLKLSLDSSDPEIIAFAGLGARRPIIFNSLALDTPWSEPLSRLLLEREPEVVLSLRRGAELPHSMATRLAWAEEGVARLAEKGVDPGRVLVDAIALPWGDDFDAGRGMIEFVEEWSRRAIGAGSLVGLGNLGHGHPDAVRINREWWSRLRSAGIAAALVDAFEPGLRTSDGDG